MSPFDFMPEFETETIFPCKCNTNNEENGNTLAMAYVPTQEFDDYYTDYSEALDKGSLFKDLVKPFYGKRGAAK